MRTTPTRATLPSRAWRRKIHRQETRVTIQPPMIGAIIGAVATITPMWMNTRCRCGPVNRSLLIAKTMAELAAAPAPWRNRPKIIMAALSASPQTRQATMNRLTPTTSGGRRP